MIPEEIELPFCCCSVTKLCPTLWDPVDCRFQASLSLNISRSLLRFMSIDTSTTEHHHFCFGPAASFFLELLVIALRSPPLAYWTASDLGAHLAPLYHFAFSCCSWGSRGKNAAVVCHSLLQWTTFCQNAPLGPIHPGGPTQHDSQLHWAMQALLPHQCCDPWRGELPYDPAIPLLGLYVWKMKAETEKKNSILSLKGRFWHML